VQLVGTMTRNEFEADKKTVHVVVRNLEVIGEAIKRVPPEGRNPNQQVPCYRIARLRDILIHHYFRIDIDIVWDTVQNKLPELKVQIEGVLGDTGEKPAS